MRILRYLLGMGVGLGLLTASTVSHAVVMDPTVSFGDANFVGVIQPDTPSNPASEVDYINELIMLAAGAGPVACDGQTCDRSDSTLAGPFDMAVLAGADKQEGSDTTFSTGEIWQYILAKYAGGGESGGGALVWYFDEGVTGDITVPGAAFDPERGLSHISLYNGTTSVPEPGTLTLLGLGLLAAFGIQRRRQAG